MKLTLTALAAKALRTCPDVPQHTDEPKPYGCWNRKPIVTVCKPTCQYTYTSLGQADARCVGCRERFPGLCGEQRT